MAVEALNLDPNVWYYIQSFGTDYYLEAGSGSTSMILGSQPTPDTALWQYGTIDGSSEGFLRSKADKTCFVPVISSSNQDTVPTGRETCSNSSLTWTVADWNGQNVADGLFFSSDDLPGTYYVFAQLDSQVPVLQKQSSGNASSSDVYYQWAFSSVSQINDESFSTLFDSSSSSSSSGSGSSQTSSPTTTTSQQSGSSSSSNGESSSTGSSSNGVSTTSTTSSSAVETAISTTVVIVTPTVTDSQSTGHSTLTVIVTVTPTQSATNSPSTTTSVGLNSAGKPSVVKTLALVVGFCALCLPHIF